MRFDTSRLTRRHFLGGVAAAALGGILAACGNSTTSSATPGATTAPAKPTSSAAAASATSGATANLGATTATTAAGGTQAAGTAPPLQNLTLPASVKRGQGGAIRLLWWEAPTILNPHLSQGTKDFDAARLVIEPLATLSNAAFTPDVPVLAKEIPSKENGGLAADGTSVTWKLKDGVVWSDGQPLTADDVIFTWKFVIEPKNGATTLTHYDLIKDITAIDKTTIKITFNQPTATWYLPFTGAEGGVLPKHVLESCTNPTQCAFNQHPIGTGPYVVTEFAPGDRVRYSANEKFREPNAPFFATVEMKGGGDAVTAVKAVIAGQADYAWNPQVEPSILKQVTDSGMVLGSIPGTGVEKIYVNFADPSIEVDGEKSSLKSKSPFWSDKNVREALALALDRKAIAENLYGPAGGATNTLIPTIWEGIPWEYNPKRANDLLDQAGWKMGSDGVRTKDGKPFAITFRTSVNPVRDKESQVIKENLKAIGITVDLRPVDAGVFFGQPDNPDNLARFQTDLEMYTNGVAFPDAQTLQAGLTSDKIDQKANGWKLGQVMRWVNPEYDGAVKQLETMLDPQQRIAQEKKIDTIIIGDYAVIPLVARKTLAVYAKGLEGVNQTNWDSDVWNIAHWTKR
jgi:peptide/nickel transport system substrate-binding protein